MHPWGFLGGPVVKAQPPSAEGAGQIPGQGTKNLQATGCGQKFKNKLINYLKNKKKKENNNAL